MKADDTSGIKLTMKGMVFYKASCLKIFLFSSLFYFDTGIR